MTKGHLAGGLFVCRFLAESVHGPPVETCGQARLKSLELADIVGVFVGLPHI
jgi:hypothetical protein